MSATLVAITSSPRDPKRIEKKLSDSFSEAWRKSDRSQEGLFFAAAEYQSFLESRCTRLEQQVRFFLTSDTLTTDHRGKLHDVLYGTRAIEVNPKFLIPAERRLIEKYRALDTAERRMLRVLLDRLVKTQDVPGGAR